MFWLHTFTLVKRIKSNNHGFFSCLTREVHRQDRDFSCRNAGELD